MSNVRAVFLVGLVGLTASAFAAVPAQSTTREDRMASALKDYEGGTKASAATSTVGHMKAHHRAGKHLPAKRAAEHKT